MRRGWDAQPSAADGDAAELRQLRALVHPIAGPMDTAPLVDVLQADKHGRRPIPVRLVGPVDIHSVGVRLGGMFSLVLPLTPVKIVSEDPRRAVLMMGSPSGADLGVRLGRSQAEAADAGSFQVTSNSVGPYVFRFVEELWARAETAPVRVSFAVMQWTR